MNDTESAGNKTRIAFSRTTLRVTFGAIAALAFLGNGLVCAVILRSRTMLKNSYNLLILSLAFTDMFTGKEHVIKATLNGRTKYSWAHYNIKAILKKKNYYIEDHLLRTSFSNNHKFTKASLEWSKHWSSVDQRSEQTYLTFSIFFFQECNIYFCLSRKYSVDITKKPCFLRVAPYLLNQNF